jgi:hypothetical protein
METSSPSSLAIAIDWVIASSLSSMVAARLSVKGEWEEGKVRSKAL